MRKPLHLIRICTAIMPILICGCSLFGEGFQARSSFEEANVFFGEGNYEASLGKYAQIMEEFPTTGDRALFEMGIIHAHPQNAQKDYQKSLECFQKLTQDYPGSRYRQDSEMMVFYLNNVAGKDRTINTQQSQIEALRRTVEGKELELARSQHEILALQQKIAALEQKISTFALLKGPADRILIEKKARRLTLLAKGEVLKTYRIALGGNPVGPKERQGDHKTPEGTYFIDAKNEGSRFHLSLHISYPNASDMKRARELDVSPGGDIMIHGLKEGFSWVGDAHAEVDWTKGCIAVTDEEIEEIFKSVPVGTLVEIKP